MIEILAVTLVEACAVIFIGGWMYGKGKEEGRREGEKDNMEQLRYTSREWQKEIIRITQILKDHGVDTIAWG